MRALYLKDLDIRDKYAIEGKALHHLVNVVRIEQGENLLLLNGNGRSVMTLVESISKKSMQLKFLEENSKARQFQFDLALGIPKREALELCLKQSTELGFRKIYLIRSEYSQNRIPEEDRIENLLISALEQSNALYLPEILSVTWESLPWALYQSIIMMDSQSGRNDSIGKLSMEKSSLLVIGPEGGFSQREIEFLHSKETVKIVKLPTPILRSPTAVATGAGIMLQSLLD